MLSFDRGVVSRALSEVQGFDGDLYLEKIVQLPVDLPPVSRKEVREKVETGDAISAHDFAALVGYSASGIYPYMAHECIADLAAKGALSVSAEEGVAMGFKGRRRCSRQ